MKVNRFLFSVLYCKQRYRCRVAAIFVLAGSGLGGGTRVNWGASFRTPQHVREEWANVHGLADVTSERYDRALNSVCARLGVHENGRSDLDSNATLFKRGFEVSPCCKPADLSVRSP